MIGLRGVRDFVRGRMFDFSTKSVTGDKAGVLTGDILMLVLNVLPPPRRGR